MNNYAQGGTIKGRVIDKESSEVLIGANIIVLLTKLGAATDVNGYYEIQNIFPGIYNIKVSYVGYSSVTLEGARVTNAGPLILNFELEWDHYSSVDIFQEKPKQKTACTLVVPTESGDYIPIKEFYFINMLDSLKQNPPELKPVDIIKPNKDYDK